MKTALASLAFAPLLVSAAPTFHKDVLPILQNRCQECHRAGEIGPASFMSYKETRPWAKAIREAVISKKMPPWFADPHYGRFSNAMGLTPPEIDTIVRWADGGSPEGDPRDLPKPVEWVEYASADQISPLTFWNPIVYMS